jgi:hypothetical protein
MHGMPEPDSQVGTGLFSGLVAGFDFLGGLFD